MHLGASTVLYNCMLRTYCTVHIRANERKLGDGMSSFSFHTTPNNLGSNIAIRPEGLIIPKGIIFCNGFSEETRARRKLLTRAPAISAKIGLQMLRIVLA